VHILSENATRIVQAVSEKVPRPVEDRGTSKRVEAFLVHRMLASILKSYSETGVLELSLPYDDLATLSLQRKKPKPEVSKESIQAVFSAAFPGRTTLLAEIPVGDGLTAKVEVVGSRAGMRGQPSSGQEADRGVRVSLTAGGKDLAIDDRPDDPSKHPFHIELATFREFVDGRRRIVADLRVAANESDRRGDRVVAANLRDTARRIKGVPVRPIVIFVVSLFTLGVAYTVDQAFGGHALRWLIKQFSSPSRRPPTPPLKLPGEITIEGVQLPASDPTQRVLNSGGCCTFTLLWANAKGDAIAAQSLERLRYLREQPDSEIIWTWVVTVDGVVRPPYETTAPAIHLRGFKSQELGFSVSIRDDISREFTVEPNDGRGVRVVTGGKTSEPVDVITDRGLTLSDNGGKGIRIHDPDRRVFGRESWRPPRFQYSCDTNLRCTFLLSTGPYHPCWQRVEVQLGDGKVLDTADKAQVSTDPAEQRDDHLTLVPGPPLKDDWDATMVRVHHRYSSQGVVPFKFGIRKADSSRYEGPCEPGPPGGQVDPWRWFEADLRIAPLAHGQLPEKPGSSFTPARP